MGNLHAGNIGAQMAPFYRMHLPVRFYLTGLTSWVYCLIVAYTTLGGFWTIIGLVVGGLGIFPVAVAGVAIRGEWSTLWLDLVPGFLAFLTPRFVGAWLTDLRYQTPAPPPYDAADHQLLFGRRDHSYHASDDGIDWTDPSGLHGQAALDELLPEAVTDIDDRASH